MEECEKEEYNQLALVEQSIVRLSLRPNPTLTGKSLNLAAPFYKPTSPRIEASMDINKGGVERSGKENNQATLKESTAQWVNRAFGGNVTTNISCQDVLSLSLDTMTTAE